VAVNRTYIVDLPWDDITGPSLLTQMDIVLEIPGSPELPVMASGGTDVTTPPPGWLNTSGAPTGNGAYYEVRGRPVRFESVDGDPNFVPRGRLGYRIDCCWLDSSGTGSGDSPTDGVPMITPSKSITGDGAAGIAGVMDFTFADPSYGPVLRINGANITKQGLRLQVNLSLFEARDEDRNPTGAAP
jgi:hypothetical protein